MTGVSGSSSSVGSFSLFSRSARSHAIENILRLQSSEKRHSEIRTGQ
jgi:hypothetical protein